MGVHGSTQTHVSETTGDNAKTKRCWKILVIEDDADTADTLGLLLELMGQEVEVAYGGEEGLRKARHFQPQLVFCDLAMPELDGFKVAKILRQDSSPPRLIAISGYTSEKHYFLSRQAGFERHLIKPVEQEQLEEILAAPKETGYRERKLSVQDYWDFRKGFGRLKTRAPSL